MRRGRIIFIGDERTGKTSTKKSLLGMEFDPQEPITEAIKLDQSSFEFNLDHVQCWKTIEVKQGQSDLTDQVARIVAVQVKTEEENRKKREAVRQRCS